MNNIMKFYMDKFDETKDYQYLVGAYEKYLNVTPCAINYTRGLDFYDYDKNKEFLTWVDKRVSEWNNGATFTSNDIINIIDMIKNDSKDIDMNDINTWRITGMKDISQICRAIRFIDKLNFKLMGLSIDKYMIVENSNVWNMIKINNDFNHYDLDKYSDVTGIVSAIHYMLDNIKGTKVEKIIIDMFRHFLKNAKANLGDAVEDLLKLVKMVIKYDDKSFKPNIYAAESLKDIFIQYGIIDDKGIDGIEIHDFNLVDKVKSNMEELSKKSLIIAETVIKYNQLASDFPEVLSRWLYYAVSEWDDNNVIEDIQLEDCSDVNINKLIEVRDALNELIETHSIYTNILNKE